MTRNPTPDEVQRYRERQAQQAANRTQRARQAREQAARTAPVGANTPWKWDESNPLYVDRINQERNPPMPKEAAPQGDIHRTDLGWDSLDAELDKLAEHSNELLDALREALEREAIIKTSDREREREMARTFPAMEGKGLGVKP